MQDRDYWKLISQGEGFLQSKQFNVMTIHCSYITDQEEGLQQS